MKREPISKVISNPQLGRLDIVSLSAFALNSDAFSEKIRRDVRKNTGSVPAFLMI